MAEVSCLWEIFPSLKSILSSASDPGEESSGAKSPQQQDRVCPADCGEREGDDPGGRSYIVKYFLVDPQKEHEDQMYALNKLSELLKKMLLNS